MIGDCAARFTALDGSDEVSAMMPPGCASAHCAGGCTGWVRETVSRRFRRDDDVARSWDQIFAHYATLRLGSATRRAANTLSRKWDIDRSLAVAIRLALIAS